MCEDASFVQDRAGKIYDLAGITESHTATAATFKLDGDKCNKWEWTPDSKWGFDWTGDGWQEFLREDSITFTPPATHYTKIKSYLKGRFPDRAAWESARTVAPKWHMQKVVLDGHEVTVVCKDTESLTEGTFTVYGSATIQDVGDSATIQHVGDSATIQYVHGSATIQDVHGSATIQDVGGSATIQYVYDSATIQYVHGSATIQHVYGSATIQDVGDSATIQHVGDSATIQDVGGSATIQDVGDSATIQHVGDSATIQDVGGSATIQYVYGSATIQDVHGSATIQDVHGSATIQYVHDSATIQYVYGSATIQDVGGSATIIVPRLSRWAPKLPTRIKGSAVLIDRRNGKLVITTAMDAEVKKV